MGYKVKQYFTQDNFVEGFDEWKLLLFRIKVFKFVIEPTYIDTGCSKSYATKLVKIRCTKMKKGCNKKKTLAQQSCARKAGFLYLLKQQFSFSLKHKY